MSNIKGRMFSSPQRKAIVAVFCIIILFVTGYGIGVLANINVYLPMKEVAVAATEATTAPTTTAPTTVPTTVPTTLPPETTTTTTAPATTAAAEEDECCLAGLCDTIKGLLGTVFPCLAEEE